MDDTLKRIRSLVPRQTLLKMYEALVAPYINNYSEVWGCMGKGLCDRLQRDCKIRLGEL